MRDFDAVSAILNQYFTGLHYADTKRLRSICAPQLTLRSPGVSKALEDWLSLVDARPVPAKLGHTFQYKILSLDIVGEQAMAKLACPLLDYHYIDFIGLLKENAQWKIVSKMYCNVLPLPQE